MPRVRKPRVKEPRVPLTPEQKKIRRRERALERARNPKQPDLPVDFDWSTIPAPPSTRVTDYVYRCSVKCLRKTENPPLSPDGVGCYFQFKDGKKLRWMCAYERRSHRDAMLRECKQINGRKARKEPNRETLNDAR